MINNNDGIIEGSDRQWQLHVKRLLSQQYNLELVIQWATLIITTTTFLIIPFILSMIFSVDMTVSAIINPRNELDNELMVSIPFFGFCSVFSSFASSKLEPRDVNSFKVESKWNRKWAMHQGCPRHPLDHDTTLKNNEQQP